MPRDPKRPAHPLRLLGIPALLWLLLATTCTPFVLAAGRMSAGPLSEQDQAEFRAANRELIFEQVGPPPGTSLEATQDVSNEDEHDEVTGVTTTFRLVMPVPVTPRLDAFRAAHPHWSGVRSPELDALSDAEVYAPAWRKLDEVGDRLKRLGFREADDQTYSSLQSRSVSLRRREVTVWLGFEYPGGRISVYRSW